MRPSRLLLWNWSNHHEIEPTRSQPFDDVSLDKLKPSWLEIKHKVIEMMEYEVSVNCSA